VPHLPWRVFTLHWGRAKDWQWRRGPNNKTTSSRGAYILAVAAFESGNCGFDLPSFLYSGLNLGPEREAGLDWRRESPQVVGSGWPETQKMTRALTIYHPSATSS
jgi:hypothetical protein